jgi:hypothetical protein
MDMDGWILTYWIWLIWIWTFEFWISLVLQDISVDRDVKMLICSALPFDFRAPVVLLRRLVIYSGFSDV